MDITDTISNYNSRMEHNEPGEAVNVLTLAIAQALKEDDTKSLAQLYFLRGKTYWRLDRRGAAISDYERAVALDPDSDAGPALTLARDIMNFFNPDLFNP